ncbi:MAG: alpha/beta fold hydrolase [Solirubrobacteraceae bacterium]
MRPLPHRLATTLVVFVAAFAFGAARAAARDGYVTSFDGTKISYSFFPDPSLAAGQTAPTVMFGPGYSSARSSSSDATVQALLAAGYNVMTWDPRGFGDSGGDVELDSPAYEARDGSALIDRIAQQPEAQLDGPNDPRIGMVGASYGGGIQLTSAEIDKRIDVIAPQIAWNSLVTSLDKSNTAKGGWGTLLTALGAEGSTTGGVLGGLMGEPAGAQIGDMQDPRIYQAFQDGLTTGEFTPADQAFFAAASPAPLIGNIHIPVLLMQGTDDTLFTLHEAIANYAALRANGVPVQMLWFCGSLTDNPGVAHGQCLTPKGPDPQLTLHFELRWLAHYLKGDTSLPTGPGFTWISDAGTEHTTPAFPTAPGPPVTASGSGTLPIIAGDTSGELIVASRAANAVNVPLSTPAAGTELLGEPALDLTYNGAATNPDSRLYAQIISNANGLVLGNQVTPLPVTLDGRNHTLSIPLEAVAADVAPGSTYTLQITDGSNLYFAARSAGLVTLSHIGLSVPTVASGASSVVTTPTPSGPTPATLYSCAKPSGRLAGRSLGPVRLGMTRSAARSHFHRYSLRGRRYMDFFCPSHQGIRVGYASPALLRALSGHQARQVRGRAVLVLTADRHFALRGVRPASRLSAARRHLSLGRGYVIGLNHWYIAPDGRSEAVLKVRHGEVQEIGIADRALTGRRLARRFLASFS